MKPYKSRELAQFLERNRRFKGPKYRFTSSEQKSLDDTPIEEFFRPEFLETTLFKKGEYKPVSFTLSAPKVLHYVRSLWPNIKTVAQLAKKLRGGGIYDLVAQSGFGGSTFVVVMDSFCAFGYDIPYDPPELSKSQLETAEMRRAKELAKKLGILK